MVLKFVPLCDIRDVKLEYKALKEKVKEINKKDAKFYGNMFAKLNKQDAANSAVSVGLYNPLISSFTSCSIIDTRHCVMQKSAPKEPEPMSIDSKA